MTLDKLPPVDTAPMTIKRKRRWPMGLFIGLAVTTILAVGSVVYAFDSIGPVNASNNQTQRFVVKEGESAAVIAQNLESAGLIKNAFIFQLYTKFTGKNASLLAGGYVLKKSFSLAEIANHISSGKTDEITVTILPGLTLKELADPEVKGSLASQGYSEREITAAFAKSYEATLLTRAPIAGSLEGYIYPETYKLMADNSLEQVVQMSMDEFYKQISSRDLQDALQKQNLSLRDGIILASIVQKEVSNATDQKQVAQVFLKRLRDGTVLGSDVTFIYAAKLENRTPSVNDDSPYNTRKHGGLPPGPIANFSISALEAVAHPAEGDYVYFVAGDDGKTYFARTEAEHLDNVAKYCHTLCQ